MALTEEMKQSELYKEITAEMTKSIGEQMNAHMRAEQAPTQCDIQRFSTLLC